MLGSDCHVLDDQEGMQVNPRHGQIHLMKTPLSENFQRTADCALRYPESLAAMPAESVKSAAEFVVILCANTRPLDYDHMMMVVCQHNMGLSICV